MSQGQPLSTLAPEYDNTLQPTKVVVIEKIIETHDHAIKCNDEVKDLCVKDPCVKDPCIKDPCIKDPCAVKSEGHGWRWLGALILWFIVFTVLFWLIFYSLKPSFVLQNDSNQVDTGKVLLASVIAAIILVIIIWLIKTALFRY